MVHNNIEFPKLYCGIFQKIRNDVAKILYFLFLATLPAKKL